MGCAMVHAAEHHEIRGLVAAALGAGWRWCTSTNVPWVQPGTRQRRSRASTARRSAGGMLCRARGVERTAARAAAGFGGATVAGAAAAVAASLSGSLGAPTWTWSKQQRVAVLSARFDSLAPSREQRPEFSFATRGAASWGRTSPRCCVQVAPRRVREPSRGAPAHGAGLQRARQLRQHLQGLGDA